MPQKFTNRAVSTLQAGINNSVTSLAVAGPDADLYAVADTGTSPVNTGALTWFKAMIIDTSGNYEIVHVRTRTGGSATFSNVIRGQDGTTAQSFSAGASVICYITAADAETMLAHPSATPGAHAATAISNTPAGNIAATTVQDAINELDSEKLAASAVSGFGATLIDDADAAAARATLVVPSRSGTDATGTWPISVSGSAATATSATTSTTATNLAGGDAGQEPYQTAAGVTAMLAAGTAGQIKQSNGTGAPIWADKIKINSSVATTSGTSVTLTTTIPSTAKRISILFNNTGTNGTSPLLIQGGSGSFETTGYQSSARTGTSTTTATTGYITSLNGAAAATVRGKMVLDLVTGNTWMASCSVATGSSEDVHTAVGVKTFGGVLDRLRVTTLGGTDTFDDGGIVVTWE